jgi:CheY-like chemotaxis protein
VKKEIHIVYLEDDPADAARFDEVLHKSGLNVHSRRVETRADFLQALEQLPDVILSDHGLPSFDGLSALGLAREKCPDVPFIFVTDALSRDMEIEKLNGGVTDYVPKSKLGELPTAVFTALREVEKRTLQRDHIEWWIQSGLWNQSLTICSCCKKIRDDQDHWKVPEVFFRDRLRLQFSHGLCPECMPKYFPPDEK